MEVFQRYSFQDKETLVQFARDVIGVVNSADFKVGGIVARPNCVLCDSVQVTAPLELRIRFHFYQPTDHRPAYINGKQYGLEKDHQILEMKDLNKIVSDNNATLIKEPGDLT